MRLPTHTLMPTPRYSLIAGLVISAWSSHAVAQPSPPPASGAISNLPEVVISANRREQSSFEAPAAINSVDANTIGEAGPRVNLSEALNRIPGVAVLNRQNYAQDLQLSIRGFGGRSTFGIRGVRLIVDGIPATIPDGQGQASTIALGSAQRIEVLRGPLAQLYGNAAGGVVQVFSQDGTTPGFGELSFAAGSDGLRRWGLLAGGQSGSVNYLVDYSNLSIDGYRDWSAAKREQLNTKWRFDLGTATRLTVVANLFDQPLGRDPLGLTRAQWATNPQQSIALAQTQNTGKTVQQNQLGATLEHRIDANNSVSGRLYYGTRDVYTRLSVPLAAQSAATSAGGIVDLDRSYSGVGLQYQNRWRVAQGLVQTTLGVDADSMNERRRGFINNAGVQGALKRDEDDRVSNLDYYLQSTWFIDPRWSITAGARSSTVRFKVQDAFIVPGNPDDSGQQSYRATNPVLGVTYTFNDRVNAYAQWGRGFETPTFTELAYRNTGSGLNFGLQASRSQHAEVGVKARIGDGQRLDLALFSIGTENELAVDANSGGRSTFRNVGRTERTGIELSHRAQWSPSVSSLLALTSLQAQFRDSFNASGGGVVNAGNTLPGVPQRLMFGEVVWRSQNPQWRGLHAGLEMVHSGKVFVNDLNSDSAESYTLAHARVGWRQQWGPWEFRQLLRVDNLTDKRYIGSVIVNDANGRYFESAPGRTWMASVSARVRF